ncbi:MAG: hypothetical protein RIS97_472 [Pseudomonadota bacterium]
MPVAPAAPVAAVAVAATAASIKVEKWRGEVLLCNWQV